MRKLLMSPQIPRPVFVDKRLLREVVEGSDVNLLLLWLYGPCQR
eukprot:COSAG02_NODE_24522_length_685_cov_1.715017_2_plen_43_part_01